MNYTYIAIVIMPTHRLQKRFPTMSQAEQWLDANNNNHQYSTIIGIADETDHMVDSFFYTVAAK